MLNKIGFHKYMQFLKGNLGLALHFAHPKVIDWSGDKFKKVLHFYVLETERPLKSQQYDKVSPWRFRMESGSSGLASPKSYIRETTMTSAPDLASHGNRRKRCGGGEGMVLCSPKLN